MHPQFVTYPAAEQDSLQLTNTGLSTVIAPTTSRVLAAEDTPGWVAAGTRYLEVQQADWLESSPAAPTDDAAVTALHSVSNLLEAHVLRNVPDEVIV
jgi:hypothetical protein